MTAKLFFLFFSKIFSFIGAIFLSILCFPKINILFFSLPNAYAIGIWLTPLCLSVLFSVAACFVWKSKTSIVDHISSILLNFLLFVISFIESIFLQYDTESGNLIFYLIGAAGIAGSILLSIFWLHNTKLIYKKEKENNKNFAKY